MNKIYDVNMINKGKIYPITQIMRRISNHIVYTNESLKANLEDYFAESVVKGEFK